MPKARKHVLNKYEHMGAEMLFTDREEPRKAFWELYDSMENGDYEVLTYYGIGGIGKTSLLYKLCGELKEKAGKNKVPNYAFFSFESFDTKEDFLFRLSRRMMMYNKKLKFPLFDTAFAKIANDDNQDLNKYIENTKKSFMDNRIVDTAISIAGQIVPGLESAAKVVDVIYGLVDSKSAEKECKSGEKSILYNEIQNEKNIVKIKDKLHEYFLEDVYYVMEQSDTPYVIFIDGYENYVSLIKDGNLSKGRDNWIREKLVEIPNVLWVIAGRERLKWREEILPNEHQHRMGELSELDVIEFFKKAEIEDEELIKALYRLTNGTPAYLDLCGKTYYDVLETKQPEIEDFGRDTTELVNRYLKKMRDEDQSIMIMLSFLPKVWDLPMAEAVAKALDYGAYIDNLHKLINLSLFERVDNGIKMHETSRVVIKEAHMDRQERIGTAIIQYLTGILLTSKDSMDYMHRCMQFAESMELCDAKVVSDEDMQTILFNINEKLNSSVEYQNIESILLSLEQKLEMNEYDHNIVSLCLGSRCINLCRMGNYEESLEVANKNLVFTENHQDIDSYFLIKAYADMGCVLLAKGEYQESLEFLTKAYGMELEEFGESHLDTLETMANIAIVYKQMGEFDISNDMCKQIYEIRREEYGEYEMDTINALSDVAVSYQDLGEYDKALKLFEEAYEKMKDKVGECHPDTLAILNNGAISYRCLNKSAEAKKYFEYVYDKSKAVLGEKHLLTITALYNIALAYDDLGEYDRAKELLECAYVSRKQMLGEKHPETIIVLHDKANTCVHLDEYEEAKKLEKQAYEMMSAELGKDHPQTIRILSGLANIHNCLEEYDEAVILYKQLYEKSRYYSDENTPETFGKLNDLACAYMYLGDFESAHELYAQMNAEMYTNMESQLGEYHIDIIIALYNRAHIYMALGEFVEAKKQYEILYNKKVQQHGQKHPETLSLINELAGVYNNLEEYEQTKKLYEEVYETMLVVIGNSQDEIATALYNMIVAYSFTEEFDKAKNYCEQLYEIRKMTFGKNDPTTLETAGILADINAILEEISN